MHGLQRGKALGESVELLLCGPPYNGHRQRNLQKCNHDVIDAKDMNAFCYLAKYVIQRGGMKTSFVQQYKWTLGSGIFALACKRWGGGLER